MLYTLTTNPAIDMNVTTHEVLHSVVNRTTDALFTPNGKGLNVSFVLRHFNVPSGIIGFFGGFTGQYIVSKCISDGYSLLPVNIGAITRLNVFVSTQHDEYKLVDRGPLVTAEEQEQLLEMLENINDIDYLSINGSSANGQSEDYYDRILKICENKKIPVILDISSPRLKTLLHYRPLLIKPNGEELQSIFGFSIENELEIRTALKEIHKMGAQNVLLSLGEKGSYFWDGSSMYYCSTKKIKQKSSACAGDAFLAGFLSIWLQNRECVEQALKRAAAAGANVAESDGLGDLLKVPEYEQCITVRKLEEEG